MTTFRADTDVMRTAAQQLSAAADEIGKISADVRALASQIDRGKHQGQLANKVSDILSGFTGQATGAQSHLGTSSTKLQNKANEIEAVSQTGASATLTMAGYEALTNTTFRALAEQLRGLNWPKALALLALAGISPAVATTLWGHIAPAAIVALPPSTPVAQPVTASLVNKPGYLYSEPGKQAHLPDRLVRGQTLEILETKTTTNGETWYQVRQGTSIGWLPATSVLQVTQLSASETRGENVRAGLTEAQVHFPRYVNGVPSNCTWLAAASVLAASQGKIDLDNRNGARYWLKYPPELDKNGDEIAMSLGNGGDWGTNADKLVKGYKAAGLPESRRPILGVDTSPVARDVYTNDSYHVAYVEETWLSVDGKKVVVVVTEENAGNYIKATDSYEGTGGAIEPSASVAVHLADAPSVARWRRTIVFENIANPGEPPKIAEGQGRFIHFNYVMNNTLPYAD